MDIDKYLTMKCSWEQKTGSNERFMTDTYAAAQDIDCFVYGDIVNLRYSTEKADLSGQTILVKADVNVGDKINGQLVKKVLPYPDFDGAILYKEVHIMD